MKGALAVGGILEEVDKRTNLVGENRLEILMFRLMQYWGGFRGNHEHRKLSEKLREEYFYPK